MYFQVHCTIPAYFMGKHSVKYLYKSQFVQIGEFYFLQLLHNLSLSTDDDVIIGTDDVILVDSCETRICISSLVKMGYLH